MEHLPGDRTLLHPGKCRQHRFVGEQKPPVVDFAAFKGQIGRHQLLSRASARSQETDVKAVHSILPLVDGPSGDRDFSVGKNAGAVAVNGASFTDHSNRGIHLFASSDFLKVTT